MSISQNGISTAIIEPTKGIVTIVADVSDQNVKDNLPLSWNLDALPDSSDEDLQVRFSYESMSEGDYGVSITVSDDGYGLLSTAAELAFKVFISFAPSALASGP